MTFEGEDWIADEWQKWPGLCDAVIGESFHRAEIEQARRALADGPAGSPVDLVLDREPDNAADENAIKVLAAVADGPIHVGYVPRRLAAEWAPLMDQSSVRLLAVCGLFCYRSASWQVRLWPHRLRALIHDKKRGFGLPFDLAYLDQSWPANVDLRA